MYFSLFLLKGNEYLKNIFKKKKEEEEDFFSFIYLYIYTCLI